MSWLSQLSLVMDRIKQRFKHLKFDMEWCVDRQNQVHIVQLRPTTTSILVQSGYESSSFIVGSHGIAEGRAVVFYDDPDVETKKDVFKPGDIFVGEYMDTRYYEFLEKAAGIVVGNSSILAHAALVARENHIPCVIVSNSVIDRIRDNDRVCIDTYSKTIHINEEKVPFCEVKVDWAEMYDFDSINQVEYMGNPILLENTLGGIVAHVPDEFSNESSNALKKEYRKLMGCDIEIKKGYKYLWYFEYLRYRRIDLFNVFVDLLIKAIDIGDQEAIARLYERGYVIAGDIFAEKSGENSVKKRIYLDEVVRSIFFVMDMYIPLGCGHKKIYQTIIPLLMEENLSFIEFLSCDKKDLEDPKLLAKRELIDLLQTQRDQVTTRFCERDMLDYDYYDHRTELICGTLGAASEEVFLQAVMEEMEPLNKVLSKKYEKCLENQ